MLSNVSEDSNKHSDYSNHAPATSKHRLAEFFETKKISTHDLVRGREKLNAEKLTKEQIADKKKREKFQNSSDYLFSRAVIL